VLHVQSTPQYASGAGARHAVDHGRPYAVSAAR
jgi:hypothetical protein